jgi:hypothetical protein
MRNRIRIKIATTIAAAAVISVAAASASAAPSKNFWEPGSTGYVPATHVVIPERLSHLREPGSTGYLPATHVVIPERLSHLREPGSTGFVPRATLVTVASAADGGFDWVSALIGGAVTLGVGVAGAGAVTALRRRRPLAHV